MKIKNILQNFGRKFFGLDNASSLGWRTLIGCDNESKHANSFLASNIRAITTAACNGELKLYKADGEEISYTRKGKEPLLDLLYQPSRFYNENLFKQIVVSQLLIYGNVFVLKAARDAHGRPTALIPIPKPSVTILKDSMGYPRGYKISTRGGSQDFPLEDVIHIHEGNANDLFEGLSRTELCGLDAQVMNSAKVFNLAFFKNGASVGGIVTFPENTTLSQQDKDEVLAFFNDSHQGASKAHRTAILARGGKYESFKTSHKDMEFAEGQKFSQQQIFSAMGVPPALVGLFEFAPQFNTKEQQKIFYETNIIPMMRLLSDAINENLVPDFYKNEDVYVAYDFSKVKALEEDWVAKSQALQILSQKFPLNECKRALGLPFSDVPGGDEPPDPVLAAFGAFAAQNPVEALLLSGQAKGAPAQIKRTRTVRPTAAQLRRHKADRLDLADRLKGVMADAMKTHFSNQRGLIKTWLEQGNTDAPFDYDAVFGKLNLQVQALLVLKVPALSEIFKAGLEFEQDYIQSLIPSKDFKFLRHKDMSDRVRFWAEHYAFLWADSIEQTTWKQLDDIIKTGVSSGESNTWINRRVLEFFSENGYKPTDTIGGTAQTVYNRVQTITNTETLATISESQLEAFKSTPYVNGKTWITTRGVTDHHEGHAEMDGQTVGVNEKFVNPKTLDKADAPGRFEEPSQNINCLCDMSPTILEEPNNEN